MTDSFVSRCILGGAAGISGWIFVHPMDVLKVRMQLLGETGKIGASPVLVMKELVKTEGVAGLYSGLSAAIARQVTYTSLRIGIYDQLRTVLSTPGQPDSFATKAAAGIGAGAIGSFVCCPVEVSLVRMQADGRLPVTEVAHACCFSDESRSVCFSFLKRRNYSSIFNALFRIAKEEGVTTYWRGASATGLTLFFYVLPLARCVFQ